MARGNRARCTARQAGSGPRVQVARRQAHRVGRLEDEIILPRDVVGHEAVDRPARDHDVVVGAIAQPAEIRLEPAAAAPDKDEIVALAVAVEIVTRRHRRGRAAARAGQVRVEHQRHAARVRVARVSSLPGGTWTAAGPAAEATRRAPRAVEVGHMAFSFVGPAQKEHAGAARIRPIRAPPTPRPWPPPGPPRGARHPGTTRRRSCTRPRSRTAAPRTTPSR